MKKIFFNVYIESKPNFSLQEMRHIRDISHSTRQLAWSLQKVNVTGKKFQVERDSSDNP